MLTTEATPLPELSLIRVTGSDRTSFVNNFCTNDLVKRLPSEGCEAFVTDAKGRILAHVGILVQADALQVMSLVSQAPALIQHWERYCITEDVQFHDRSSDVAAFAICGPDASQAIAYRGLSLPTDSWSHADVIDNDIPIQVVRLPFSTDAYVLITSTEAATELQRQLDDRGVYAAKGQVFEELRIREGLPLYGRDISSDNLPQEVHRNEQAICFTKGCYLGQETVARIDALGHVNRLLVSLRIPTTGTWAPGEPLYRDGSDRSIGSISSAVWSPSRNELVALAMIRREHAAPGTKLVCAAGTAEVLET